MKKNKHPEEKFRRRKRGCTSCRSLSEWRVNRKYSRNTSRRIRLLTQKCADLNDKNLRMMAEFDNYRKRALKERMDLLKTASEGVWSSVTLG